MIMGWTPSAKPLYPNLGELTGLREISDEERARMRENDPNNDEGAGVMRNLSEREKAVREELEIHYTESVVMDSCDLIERWDAYLHDEADTAAQNAALANPTLPVVDEYNEDILGIFYDDFLNRLDDRIVDVGSSLVGKDVYDIAMKTLLTPQMFFYGIKTDKATRQCYVVVTRCDLWNELRIIDDKSFSKYVIPDFLENPVDSRYDVIGDMTASDLRRMLRAQGFIENHEVAN